MGRAATRSSRDAGDADGKLRSDGHPFRERFVREPSFENRAPQRFLEATRGQIRDSGSQRIASSGALSGAQRAITPDARTNRTKRKERENEHRDRGNVYVRLLAVWRRETQRSTGGLLS